MYLSSQLDRHLLRVSLADDATGPAGPELAAGCGEGHSRGLRLATTTARRWGVPSDEQAPGKRVWLEYDVTLCTLFG